MKFLHPINLVQNELQNAVIQNLATPPQTPKIGQIYFNTVSSELKVWDGSSWDVIGKEYELGNDILKANISSSVNGASNTLTYTRFDTSSAGVLSSAAPTAGTSLLSWSGYFAANRINDLELTEDANGFTINGGSSTRRSLIYTGSGNLTLDAKSSKTVSIFSNLTIGDSTYPNATFTLKSDASEGRTLILGPNATANHAAFFNANGALTSEAQLATTRGGTGIGTYTTGDILYADDADSLATLGIGSIGNTLRVSGAGIPEWTIGGSVDETLVLKFDAGTTEGTDLYTFDGSTQKTIDFIGGTDIDIAKSAAAITFNHADITRTNTIDTDAPGFTGTFDVIDSITTSSTGHITAVNTTTITVPTETVLSLVDAGTGTWLTDVAVDDHEITLSRSNSTEDTITVGELVVSSTGAGSGNVTIAGDLTVNGTTTTINTETVEIEDNIIEINSTQTGTPATSLIGGLEINRGDETNYQFVFVEGTDDFRVGEVGDLQPVLTRDETTNLVNGDILVWDDANDRAVGKTFDELALPNKYAASIEIAIDQTYTITHNLNSTDVIVSLKDITSGSNSLNEMIYADIKTTGANTITVAFGEINGVEDVRVTVIG